jgi:hypothetical protein
MLPCCHFSNNKDKGFKICRMMPQRRRDAFTGIGAALAVPCATGEQAKKQWKLRCLNEASGLLRGRFERSLIGQGRDVGMPQRRCQRCAGDRLTYQQIAGRVPKVIILWVSEPSLIILWNPRMLAVARRISLCRWTYRFCRWAVAENNLAIGTGNCIGLLYPV